jgi:hypothetical protein
VSEVQGWGVATLRADEMFGPDIIGKGRTMKKPLPGMVVLLGTAVGANGTMVTHLMSKDGMVVCADRRVLVNKHAFDYGNKIQTLDKRTGFACAGTCKNLSSTNAFPAFDTYSEVANYAAKQGIGDLKTFLPQLGDLLMRKFYDSVSGMQRVGEPLPPPEPDGIYFRVLVFRMTPAHTLEMGFTQVTYTIHPTSFGINNGYAIIDKSQFETSQFFVIGSGTKVAEELKSGHDKKYDNLRKLRVARQYLIGKQKRETVDKLKAERASRRFIRLVSHHVRDFGGVEDISPDCNCLLVPFKGEAQWLDR